MFKRLFLLVTLNFLHLELFQSTLAVRRLSLLPTYITADRILNINPFTSKEFIAHQSEKLSHCYLVSTSIKELCQE